jgi:hypothetical protein
LFFFRFLSCCSSWRRTSSRVIRLLPMELINVATKGGGGGGGVAKSAFRGVLLLHPPRFCCSTRLDAIGGKRAELTGASSRYGALIISQKQQRGPRNQTCSGFKLQEAQGVDDEEFGHGNGGRSCWRK